ncbi:MAG TPA: hypothetical protein VE959_35565 [Bryobacteraceae bacterium]|nr:hypothetical protein [Bryobacteraceae bacterium]
MAKLVPLQALKVDGVCGPKTIKAIREFQTRIVHPKHADGRVDPNGPTLVKLSEAVNPQTALQQGRRYRIRTIAGGGISAGVGGSVTTFEVQDIDAKQSVYYTLVGADFGFGFKGAGSGPSSWTEFSSPRGLKDFHGYVTVISVSAAAGVGGGASQINYVTGPAAGLTINGAGWGTGLNASFGATHGWMKLRD